MLLGDGSGEHTWLPHRGCLWNQHRPPAGSTGSAASPGHGKPRPGQVTDRSFGRTDVGGHLSVPGSCHSGLLRTPAHGESRNMSWVQILPESWRAGLLGARGGPMAGQCPGSQRPFEHARPCTGPLCCSTGSRLYNQVTQQCMWARRQHPGLRVEHGLLWGQLDA